MTDTPEALRAALDRWVAARKIILNLEPGSADFKAAWHELGEAEWTLAAFSKPPPAEGGGDWVLVPREPTRAMIDAAQIKAAFAGDARQGFGFVDTYRAMVSTALSSGSPPLILGGDDKP